MALVGCGDDDDDDGNGGPTATATSTAAAATSPTAGTAEPVYGGHLQLSRSNDMALDQLTLFSAPAVSFATHVYSGLLYHRSSPDPVEASSYIIEPDLARDREQVDELTYTFFLNPEARFHDRPPVDGRALTAEDVAISYERFVTEPKNINRRLYDAVDGLPEVLDEHTIRFKTKAPYAPFLTSLVAYRQLFYVFPRELLENDALRLSNPVGTGPFMPTDIREGSAWSFEANPNWHVKDADGRRLPFVSNVTYSVIPEPAQVMAQFQAGNLHQATFTPDEMTQISADDVQVIQYIPTTHWYVSPQQRRGPFQDVRLRRALSMAIDRDGILAAFYQGEGVYNNVCGAAMGRWWLDPQGPDAGPAAEYFKYNPAEAKRLIDAAGFDEDFTLSFPTNAYGETFNQAVTLMLDTIKRAGFKVSPTTLDYQSQFIATGGKGAFFGEYEGIISGAQTAYPHAHQILANVLHSTGPHNNGGWNDPEMDRMIDELGRTFDEEEAVEKAHEIQRYANDQCYFITTSVGPLNHVSQPSVRGAVVSSPYELANAKVVWLSQS